MANVNDTDLASLNLEQLGAEGAAVSAEADAVEDEALSTTFTGTYSLDMVVEFYAALNTTLALFQQEPLPAPTEPVIGPDAVRGLEMVATAATDAGLPVPEMEAADDIALETITATLIALTEGGDLSRFLQSRAPAPAAAVAPEAAAAPAAPAGGGAPPADLEALFASRI